MEKKKAGEVYNKYSELMASKGVKVKSLEESNVCLLYTSRCV